MNTHNPSRYGLELYNELVDRLGTENQLDDRSKAALLREVQKALVTGKLTSRNPQTTARIRTPSEATPYVTVADSNEWLRETGSMFAPLSTLKSTPRHPSVLSSQWDGRSANDFEEEKRRYGTYTAAARAHGVSRQAYTEAFKRAVGGSSPLKKEKLQQGVAVWPQGLASNLKKSRNSKS